MLKISFFHVWKCIILGVVYRSGFWLLWGKPAVIFSKCLFFKIFWWYHEPYNQATCRWKDKYFFELFISKNLQFTRVIFFVHKSLLTFSSLTFSIEGPTSWIATMFMLQVSDQFGILEVRMPTQESSELKIQQRWSWFFRVQNVVWRQKTFLWIKQKLYL